MVKIIRMVVMVVMMVLVVILVTGGGDNDDHKSEGNDGNRGDNQKPTQIRWHRTWTLSDNDVHVLSLCLHLGKMGKINEIHQRFNFGILLMAGIYLIIIVLNQG